MAWTIVTAAFLWLAAALAHWAEAKRNRRRVLSERTGEPCTVLRDPRLT